MPGVVLAAQAREADAGRKHVARVVSSRLAERLIGRNPTERELQVLEGIAQGRSNEATVKSHGNAILAELEAKRGLTLFPTFGR